MRSAEEGPLPGADELILALERRGWRVVGGRPHTYTRLAPESATRWSLLVPLDATTPDYEELLRAAVREVAVTYPDLWTRELAPTLSRGPTDSFRFTKQSNVPSGLIPWTQGEDLVASARATLVAGAKASRGAERHYGNRHGQFAGRFLDSVLMGQTDVGSYVVTALVPANLAVPAHKKIGDPLFDEDTTSGRAITQAVARALDATRGAVDEYRRKSSLAAFEAAVVEGVSYEFVNAVHNMAAGSEGSAVEVLYTGAGELELLPAATFEFLPDDVSVLEKASTRLAKPEAPIRHSAVGRVHLLTKVVAGGPGVFGVDEGSRKYRVRLKNAADYHRAVQAHDKDLEVRVSGQLSREGNLNWLYGASVELIVPPESPFFEDPLFET